MISCPPFGHGVVPHEPKIALVADAWAVGSDRSVEVPVVAPFLFKADSDRLVIKNGPRVVKEQPFEALDIFPEAA